MQNKLKYLGSSFWTFSIGQLISNFGDVLSYLAISFWVLQKTGSAAKFATLIIPVAIIQIFLKPFLAPLVDRFDRKKILIYTNVTAFLFVGVDLYMVSTDYFNLPLLAFLACLASVFVAMHESSIMGITKFLVQEEKLEKAIQTNEFISSLKAMIAPLIAGTAVAFLGIKTSIFLNLLSYVVALITLYLTKINLIIRHNKVGEKLTIKTWYNDLKSGYLFLRDVSDLWILFSAIGLFQIMVAHLAMSLPVLILKERHLSPLHFSFLEFAIGVGCLLAALFYGKFSKIKGKYFLFFSFFSSSLGLFILGRFNNQLLSAFFLAIMSMSNTLMFIGLTTKLSRAIPNKFQARIFSFLGIFVSGMTPLSIYIVSHVIDRTNASQTMQTFGGITFLAGIGVSLSPRIYKFLDQELSEINSYIVKKYPEISAAQNLEVSNEK